MTPENSHLSIIRVSDMFIVYAPIAQRIERCPPEAKAMVRVHVGAKRRLSPVAFLFDMTRNYGTIFPC